MTDYNDMMLQKRQHAGAKKLATRCHCGRIRARHTILEAKKCMKVQETETVGRVLTDKEIETLDMQKL